MLHQRTCACINSNEKADALATIMTGDVLAMYECKANNQQKSRRTGVASILLLLSSLACGASDIYWPVASAIRQHRTDRQDC
mmetsp:Transcript_27630/g.76051  ORF Transcript_27630/g.76051 Transcript_27630/m.76051 type:complete len:82 (+) Transcript_27630:621-866(+)